MANAIARPLQYTLRVDGKLERTEAWLDAARTIGKPLNSGWDATGGLELHLGWQWTAGQSFPRPSGALIAHLLDVRLPLVNQPIELAEARLDLSAGERRVTVDSRGRTRHALAGHDVLAASYRAAVAIRSCCRTA